MGGGKHGHHGGAWKVAYADFVTAMMALFLVLWLVSQDEKIKDAVAKTFKNPFNSLTREATGIISNQDVALMRDSRGSFDAASNIELKILRKLSEDILKTLQANPELPDETPLRMDLLGDGIRLSMFDRNQRPIFKAGSAEFTEYGEWAFVTLAWQITRFTNHFQVELEGHTEAGFETAKEGFDAWDLSTARAHAVRHLLLKHEVDPRQFRRVAGYADTAPLRDTDVADERNRRVAVILKASDGVKSRR
jgi:chemotaxis protein MotB